MNFTKRILGQALSTIVANAGNCVRVGIYGYLVGSFIYHGFQCGYVARRNVKLQRYNNLMSTSWYIVMCALAGGLVGPVFLPLECMSCYKDNRHAESMIIQLQNIVNNKFLKSCETSDSRTTVHKSYMLQLSRIFIVQNCQRLMIREPWTMNP